MKKRLLAGLLCAVLLCGFVPQGFSAALANEGLCEHHTEHTGNCGYSEGVEGSPCTHEHNEDCYILEQNCVHSHDENCYPDQTAADNTTTPSDVDEVDPTECTHVCSEESGCITKKLNCTHSHDGTCGYVEAVEGTPCDYHCSICAELESNSENANIFNPQEASQTITIEVEGEKNWGEIETAINEAIKDDPNAEVKIIGIGDKPTIMFDRGDENGPNKSLIVKLKTDTIFENVTLTSGLETTAPYVYLYAYGHKLMMSDTVQVERNKTGGFLFTIYGGGYHESVGDTYLYIDGGGFGNIIGGSYGADSEASYVYVGKTVDVGTVIGGSHGGVSAGNIEVVYAAENGPEMLKRNGVRRVIGGSVDISNSQQKADCTGGYIKVTIKDGALVTDVNGALNSMVHCKDIYINIEKGATVTRFIEGGACTSRGVPGFYPATGYDPYSGSFYETHSDIHIQMDGEGRLSNNHEYSAEIIGGTTNGNIYGNIDVTLNGGVESLVGGCYNGNVEGNINITVNGQVRAGGSNADWEIGNVPTWFDGYVNAGCFEGTLTGNTKTTIGKNGVVHAVLGGCDNGVMVGDAEIHVHGKVIKGDRDEYKNADRLTRYSGSIFGGSYMTSELDVSKQEGSTKVIVYDGATIEGDVYGGGCYTSLTGNSEVIVSGKVNGNVYGGGLVPDGYSIFRENGKIYYIGYVSENSYVELNGNASANDVYGAGCFGDIGENSTIVLKDNAAVQNVCGTGNAYYQYWKKGNESVFKQKSVPCSDVYGNVSIFIQDHAVVQDTIYGYKFYTSQKGTTEKAVDGTAEVFFEHSTGTFKRVENADLVQVTDSSNVMIDNEHQNDEQLVNVYDLIIDGSAVLELGASAHILEDYQGDAAQSGTLKIPAGKRLTADGTVTHLTKISILDNEIDNIVPKEAQVYVISGAGSTTENGDFTWIDTRNGVYMAWRANDGGTSQWWLVKNPAPERHGGLKVTKNVSGSGASTSQAFTFTVTMDGAVSGAFGDMTFKDGVATFTLKHGESKTAQNLPVGISYTVTEAEESGYTATSVGESGKIAAGQTVEAVFTNIKNADGPDPKPDPKPDDDDGPKLNTDDHYSYIIGYKDGTLRPYGTITRGEVATIFFRLLTDEARDKYWSQVNPYSDCDSDLWCNNAISTLSNMGIIDGFTDGTFRPYGKITRAQFAKIAVGFFETTAKEYQGYYSDVPENAWFTDYVEAASRVGLIQGFQDGTFRPNTNITRAQACVIVNRALDRKPDEDHLLPERKMITWPDNNPGDWFYADMQEATNSHDYTWLTKGKDKKYMEEWTKKLEQRDWAAFEHAWSTAHSAPGGEVVK